MPRNRCLATSDQAALLAGATYRELDYWTRRGYLRNTNPGSGQQRGWTPVQIRAAATMTRLVRAALAPHAAALIVHGHNELAPGIRVEVADA